MCNNIYVDLIRNLMCDMNIDHDHISNYSILDLFTNYISITHTHTHTCRDIFVVPLPLNVWKGENVRAKLGVVIF